MLAPLGIVSYSFDGNVKWVNSQVIYVLISVLVYVIVWYLELIEQVMQVRKL